MSDCKKCENLEAEVWGLRFHLNEAREQRDCYQLTAAKTEDERRRGEAAEAERDELRAEVERLREFEAGIIEIDNLFEDDHPDIVERVKLLFTRADSAEAERDELRAEVERLRNDTRNPNACPVCQRGNIGKDSEVVLYCTAGCGWEKKLEEEENNG
jgi:hypothetical protein